ncbi:MAG: ribosome small subunit-dependent GTPase A [Armatimonadota bacterium]|nr:ribosome small subunit-dependent GTPase A [Armatimonadota bacterium]MDR5696725.1 ribosome small subunit-dependent GTPase A [Armatimonadota bacterium]
MADREGLTGIVTKVLGGFFFVYHEGRIYRCVARGRLRRRDREAGVRTSQIVPGDRVRFAPLSLQEGVIEQTLPRRRELSRPLHGDPDRLQVIAANVDQACVVFAARAPDPEPHAIDRFLALAEASGLGHLLCFNKCDLADVSPLSTLYERAGYRVLRTSTRTGEGLDALRRALSGHLTVIAGPSGVGKSSLVNALAPQARRTVGEVGRRGRGRHTTTTAELLPVGADAFVVDTPGVQVLELVHLDPNTVRRAFLEIREVGTQCAFADCRHRQEPGCAVRRAVLEGRIAGSRYDSYLTLLAEAEEGERRRYR